MMMERLYYRDSYLLDFTATVTGITEKGGKTGVTLDRSAFYPTSGGQLFDTGRLGESAVVEVVEENGEVIHILDGAPAFAAGDTVKGKIDAVRRYANMQKHTGQHILSRSFIEICGAETVSAGLGEYDCTIDVNRADLPEEDINRAEELANMTIFENRPVRVDFVPHDKLREIPLRKIPDRAEGDFRIVTIEDFDWSACGGTHCRTTGSVGIIKITGREKIRGNLRFRFLTGLIALDDYRWRFDQVERVSNLMTRHGREAADGVAHLMEENTRLRRKVIELNRDLLPHRAEAWYREAVEIDGCRIITLDFSGEDFKEARETALGIINSFEAAVIIGADDKLLVAVANGMPLSAVEILKRAAERFGGRGGGSPQLAQGGGFANEDVKVLLADPSAIINR